MEEQMSGNWLLDELESASEELELVPDWARPTLFFGSQYQSTQVEREQQPVASQQPA